MEEQKLNSIVNSTKPKPNIKIKICGVGGGGGNILTRMYKKKTEGVDFIAINTDMQGLHFTKADKKVNIGLNTTKGLGAGMDPELGKKSAEENAKEIEDILQGADLIFITCGLGGGTGSGAAPIIAQIAKKTGALTVGVVTKPFTFEGVKRKEVADIAWNKLYSHLDSLITIENDRVWNVIEKETPILDAFKEIDEILRQGVQGIADLINYPGIVNLDFANLRTILTNAGESIIGIGRAKGKDRAIISAKAAISSPLLDLSIKGASRILFNISGGNDLSLYEINEAARTITETANPEAKIIFGTSKDNDLKEGELKIIVIAGGFDEKEVEEDGLFDRVENELFSTPSEKKKIEISQEEEIEEEENTSEDTEEDELDIPAFLRKKRN